MYDVHILIELTSYRLGDVNVLGSILMDTRTYCQLESCIKRACYMFNKNYEREATDVSHTLVADLLFLCVR